MTIIKEGDPHWIKFNTNKPYRFSCTRCGCVFMEMENDTNTINTYYHYPKTLNCPCCGHVVTGQKLGFYEYLEIVNELEEKENESLRQKAREEIQIQTTEYKE